MGKQEDSPANIRDTGINTGPGQAPADTAMPKGLESTGWTAVDFRRDTGESPTGRDTPL